MATSHPQPQPQPSTSSMSISTMMELEPVLPHYVTVDPEEIYADLERLRLSRQPFPATSLASPPTSNGAAVQQPQVSICGANPEMTTKVLTRLYAVGASKLNKSPPKKINKPPPQTTTTADHKVSPPGSYGGGAAAEDNSMDLSDAAALHLRLCGIAGGVVGVGTPNSSDGVARLFAAGVEAAAETHDKLCLWKEPEGMSPQKGFYDDSSSSSRGEESSSSSPSLKKKTIGNHRGVDNINGGRQELRVLEIAEDLKKAAPDLIKRENLIPMIRQHERRRRQKAQATSQATAVTPGTTPTTQRNLKTIAESPNSRQTAVSEPPNTNHEESEGEGEYPSDIDEFLDYARLVIEDLNASYDSASYKEFETVLQETIRSHFLDDTDDDDSMTSASSFSGYDGDAPSHSRRNLEENSLISESSFQRVVGTIAHKKKGHKQQPQKQKNKVAAVTPKSLLDNCNIQIHLGLPGGKAPNEEPDPAAPLAILSDDEDEEHEGDSKENKKEDASQDTTIATLDSSLTKEPRSQKTNLKSLKGQDSHDDESTLDLSAMMMSSSTVGSSSHRQRSPPPPPPPGRRTAASTTSSSHRHRSQPPPPSAPQAAPASTTNTWFTLSSNYDKVLPQCPKGHDSDSERTYTAGTSLSAIKHQIRMGNSSVLDKYRIDPEDNSLVSDTPFEPTRKIRKRRFRKKHVQIISEDDSFDEDDDSEGQDKMYAAQDVDQTVDDLAFLLGDASSHSRKTEDDDGIPRLSEVDRDAVLQKLKGVAPGLYDAVISRIESEYKKPVPVDDKREDRASSEQAMIEGNAGRDSPTAGQASTVAGSPARQAKTMPPVACTTPDRMYWADKSRDYESSEEPVTAVDHRVARGKALMKKRPSRVPRPPHPPGVKRTTTMRSPQDSSFSNISGVGLSVNTSYRSSSPTQERFPTSANDVSRGSFYSDMLDVVEDEQPSDEVPSISVDDIDTSYIFQKEGYKIGMSVQADGSFLDVMIDGFLAAKIERLNLLTRERQLTMARREQVFEQLKRKSSFMLRRVSYGSHPRMDSIEEDAPNDAGSPRVQRGRALIAKIQRRRKAMSLARQRVQEMQVQNGVEVDSVVESQAPSSIASIASPVSEAESSYYYSTDQTRSTNSGLPPSINDSHEEIRLEEFLVGSVSIESASSSPSSVSPSDSSSKRSTLSRSVASSRQSHRRKSQFLGRSGSSSVRRALHQSMDSAHESEETVRTGSTKVTSPTNKAMIVSFKPKKKKKKERKSSYEPLTDPNSSFCNSPEMKSRDILQILQPPSPESPIREYPLSGDATDDVTSLLDVAAGDLSGEDGRVLLFTDPERSGCSAQLESALIGDSFDDIIVRSVQRSTSSASDDDIFVNIRKKSSPTSITDFFSDVEPFPWGKDVPQWDEPGELSEDDQAVHRTLDLEMLQDGDDDEDPFKIAKFYSPTRFAI